jgi:hypothetical protein
VLIALLAAMLVALECAKLVRYNKKVCTRQNGTPALHGCPDAVSGKLRLSILPLVAVYVEATNGFDLERWMAAFAHDALVTLSCRPTGKSRSAVNAPSGISSVGDRR